MELIKGTDIEIKVSDITVCYDDEGVGEIPIILVHGFPFNKESWKPQFDFLKLTNRVIAYDIRGFGKSTSGKDQFSIHLFADDLIGLMDALQIHKAIICGLSMGGYIALNAIHRYAERFEALILMDTQCNSDTAEGRKKRFDTIENIEANGLVDYASNSVKNLFCKRSFDAHPEIIEEIKQTILHTPVSTVTNTLRALAERSESCPFLSEISHFTMILCGREDAITPIDKAEFLKAGIKNSTLHIIEDAGHLSGLENHEIVNEHLLKFVTNTLARF